MALQPRNILRGALWGLFGGAVFATFASMIIVARGGLPEDAPPVPAILSSYLIGGLLAGIATGVALPALTTRPRALLFGPFAVFPAVATFAFLEYGMPPRWDGATWFAAILASIILGVMAAHHVWKVFGDFA